MSCVESAEFVSALHDGEGISREAAKHIAECAICEVRLKEYAEMGVELRRAASVDFAKEVQPLSWEKRQRRFTSWWQKGRETMRIPRFAFAALIVALVAASSSLVMGRVRAHESGSVVLLKVTRPGGKSMDCALSTVDEKWMLCGYVQLIHSGSLIYQVKLVSRDGDRVQLAVQSKLRPTAAGVTPNASMSPDDFVGLPEQRYWFEPGETLQVEVDGFGNLPVTGQWIDHVPALVAENPEDLDPAANELRIVSPVLLRGKAVVADLEGASSLDDEGHGIQIYAPGEGRFQLSLQPVPGAIEGHVEMNRLSFESEGRKYELLTGVPIARADEVWVLHDARFVPSKEMEGEPFIGYANLKPAADSPVKN